MAKNSAYLQRLRQQREAEHQVVMLWSVQLALDIMSDVLNDSAVLGKSALGAARLHRVQDAFNDRFPEYCRAISKDPEADYLRVKIDQKQRQIFGPEALPWERRYDGWEASEK